MNRVIFLILFSINTVLSNDNVVKTSELELLLFKIGFQSLLKDIEITKEKTKLNENEISKIRLMVDELYINRRVIKNDNSTVIIKDESYKEEIKKLHLQINFLKEEIKKLSKITEESSKIHKKRKEITARVVVDELNVKNKPYYKAAIIYILKRNNTINIEYCDNFNWCKIENETAYIPKHLLKF